MKKKVLNTQLAKLGTTIQSVELTADVLHNILTK